MTYMTQFFSPQPLLPINYSMYAIQDDGRTLLSACLEGNWGRAAELVKSGSYLGARCKVHECTSCVVA